MPDAAGRTSMSVLPVAVNVPGLLGVLMSIELLRSPERTVHPLDVLYDAGCSLCFETERAGESELHISLPSVWRDWHLWFTWNEELAILQTGALLDLKVPAERAEEARTLITMVNEKLWVGHFDLWTRDLSIAYRNAMMLPDSSILQKQQAYALIREAGESIDRFYPAFNFLVWGGKNAEEAMKASLFETAGNA